MNMRSIHYLFLFLFLGSFLSACQKEEIDLAESTSLVGSWQWVSSNGGITGQDRQTPASTKTTKVIQFTSTNQFISYQNGVKDQEITYTLQKGKSIYDASGQSDLIDFATASSRYSFRLENNQLYLFDEVTDGYTHRYVRIVK